MLTLSLANTSQGFNPMITTFNWRVTCYDVNGDISDEFYLNNLTRPQADSEAIKNKSVKFADEYELEIVP